MTKESSMTLDTQELKRRSFVGVVALTSRTFALQVIALVSTFILTVLLDPATFGVFFVVTAAVNFLNYFSDIGLAAALIQKHEEPTEIDYKTTFTLQQLLVVSAVSVALLFSGKISQFYNFGDGGLFLFRALVISFFLSSLKTIPSVILERKLNFHKLVVPQIGETLAFYVVAIILAMQGYGVVSFAWAALVRGIVGTLILYIIAPWKPGFLIAKSSARHLLSFGLPYQTTSFLALIKDDLLILFLGRILPLQAVGYIGWGKKWAEVALRLIMDNIIKVTFPTFSRLQHNTELLAKAIQKAFLFLALLIFPIAVGMMFMVRPIIEIVPRYTKWEPALFSFYLFTISSVLATLSSPLVNALNAIGKIKYTLYLMILWTTLTWIFVPLFVRLFDFNGVSMAAVLIGLTSFVPLIIVRKFVKIQFWGHIVQPLLGTVIMAIGLLALFQVIHAPLYRIVIGGIVAVILYGFSVKQLIGKELVPYLALLKKDPKQSSGG